MREGETRLDQVTGFVLAGGRSTRMGQDKALLQLGGVSLIERAVEKLRAVVSEVRILGSRAEFASYAPIVPDLHDGCGPLGGLEAALAAAKTDWILVLPVDMPFVPVKLLRAWVREVPEKQTARIAMFQVDGRPQPALCMLHREVTSELREGLRRSSFKLYTVFCEAAALVADAAGVGVDEVLVVEDCGRYFAMGEPRVGAGGGRMQDIARSEGESSANLWFANLNTPDDFMRAAEEIHRTELLANLAQPVENK